MAAKKKARTPSWKKAQPHQVTTGKITRKSYAQMRPDKVEWVTAKKRRK